MTHFIERVKRFHKRSETLFFGHVLFWVGAGMEILSQFPDAAAAANLQAIIPPQWLGAYNVALALLIVYLRLRNFRS